jgi:diguanylate cyclase (GGDEF)-like protein/PAS domain S-box-containing protein
MFAGLIAPDTGAAAFDEGAHGWLLQDEDSLVVAVESRGNTLFGWHRSDILGLSGAKIVHPDDRPILRSAQQRALTSVDEAPIQLRLCTPAGEWLDVECRFTAVTDSTGIDGRLTVLSLRDNARIHPDQAVIALASDLRSSFVSAPTLAQAWDDCLDRLARWTHSSAAVVWERTLTDCTVRYGRAVDLDGEAPLAARLRSVSSDTSGELGRAWAAGQAASVSVDDVCSIPISHHLDLGATSVLIPLQTDGTTRCVVELIRPTGDVGERDVAVAALLQISGTVHRRELDRTLTAGELSFRLVFDEAAIGMCIIAVDGTFVAVNAALCDFLGYTTDELVGRPYRDLGVDRERADDDAVMNSILSGVLSDAQREKRFIHSNGSEVWASTAVSLVRREGTPLHFVVQITDIGDRRTAEVELTRAMATLRAAFDHSGIGMALVHLDGDIAGQILNANPAFATITGMPLQDILGQPIGDVVHTTDNDQIDLLLREVSNANAVTQRDEFRLDNPPDYATWVRVVVAPVRDRSSSSRIAVVQIEDVTTERYAQDQLAHMALHDPLTGLPNRSLILDRIRTAQHRAERSGMRIGILYIDLDKFKDVNDSFGHEAGDQLLREVSSRFRNNLRPGDTAARFGGDEFVVLCEELSSGVEANAELEQIAERLHESLRQPVMLDTHEIFVTASIGMNIVESRQEDAHTMLSNADIAMYRAKARGRSRSEPYDATVRKEAMSRLRLGSELHHAIERGQLTVVYQPIVELPSGRARGAEALLRWTHPELGDVRPDLFIDIAEDSELIVELGAFVMDQVGRHLHELGSDDFYVTANVSARQLSRADFVDTVATTLERYRLGPHQLAVELTENVLIDAVGSSLSQLDNLRSLGVGVGVDDFGTGYASLTYLKQLPVSFVKIDKSFISGLAHDADDRTIADAVIGLAAALEIDVIAEGVETEKQAEILTELGCTFAQGYLYGRPAPPASS